MAAFVAVTLAVLARFAGGWGVPYFSFASKHGSTCRNDLTGYTCSPLTLADVEEFGDIELPRTTRVVHSSYRSTHDYQLDAVLEVPAASANAAFANLKQAFGHCVPDRPSTLDTRGLRALCVQADDASITASGETTSRVYTVASGTRRDGTRVISLFIKSR